MAVPKSQSMIEFIDWYTDVMVGKEIKLEPFQEKIYQMIQEANVHSSIWGCKVEVVRKKKFVNFYWRCVNGDDCPSKKRLSDWRYVKPSQESIDKALEKWDD